LQRFVEDLNKLYLAEPVLWRSDYEQDGFRWIDCSDHLNSVLSFLRQDAEHSNELVVIANLTPVPRRQYRVGLPRPGNWRELLNSDAAIYGGSNLGNLGGVVATDKACHGQPCSAEFILPPLSILVFRPERVAAADAELVPEQAKAMPQGANQLSSVAGGRVSLSPRPEGEGTAQASPRPTDDAGFADRRPSVLPHESVGAPTFLSASGNEDTKPTGMSALQEGRGKGEGTLEKASVPVTDSRPMPPAAGSSRLKE
jgi:hypothetical protein